MRRQGVSFSLAILIVAALVRCTPDVEEAGTDPRAALEVSPEVAAAIRAEMRIMLGSLNDILVALPRMDSAAIVRAAQASGVAGAADPALEGVLPEAFIVLGTATHQQFDSLGANVTAGLSKDSVLERLGALTANCVSCHASYRLIVRPP